MTTIFSALPVIDLGSLKPGEPILTHTERATRLSEQLYDAFATTGFAYLVNAPLSFSHEEIFTLTREFFNLPEDVKMQLAKKTFRPINGNTYRGYFPTQPLLAADNLKEGFEMGPKTNGKASSKASSTGSSISRSRFKLDEPNVWPKDTEFKHRAELEQFYDELQSLSSTLLSLVALSLGKPMNFFAHYLTDSISTLRLLHYPPSTSFEHPSDNRSSTSLGSIGTFGSQYSQNTFDAHVKLACTPHTDSGILTLLHQDSTGGLEVRNAAKTWIPAPYIPGSIVVNIGDLMAEVSGGRFVATMHRVRAPPPPPPASDCNRDDGGVVTSKTGRYSVPFFFEPGEKCIVTSVDAENDHGILYGDHVRSKMQCWVEFQDGNDDDDDD